jgi:hypothetical protein
MFDSALAFAAERRNVKLQPFPKFRLNYTPCLKYLARMKAPDAARKAAPEIHGGAGTCSQAVFSGHRKSFDFIPGNL